MSENQPRKRDGGLTFWLSLILAGNILFIISQIYAEISELLFFPIGTILLETFNLVFNGFPLWSMPLFIAYSVGSICSIVAIFMWRTVGFYAISLIAIVGLLTSMASGVLTLSIIANCISIGILAILLRTEWKLFR